MSGLQLLKNHVRTFEQSYEARFPESRRLFNEIANEYNARMRYLKAGGPIDYAKGSARDAFDAIVGKEPSDGAIRRRQEFDKYMEDVVTPTYMRGYQKASDAYNWTSDKARRGYRGTKDAYNWTSDKARRGYRKGKKAYDWTSDKAKKGWQKTKDAYRWTADTTSWLTRRTKALLAKLRSEADKMYTKAKKLKNRGKQAVCRAAKRRCNMITVEECEKSKAKLLEKLSKTVEKQQQSREKLEDRVRSRKLRAAERKILAERKAKH